MDFDMLETNHYHGIFWLLAFICSSIFAFYYIHQIFEKWDTNPVLVAFNPIDATLDEIPFPAITICNMNQAKMSEVKKILNQKDFVNEKLLRDFCNLNNSFEDEDFAPDWEKMEKFFIQVGPSCQDTMKTCVWQSQKVNCEDFFNNDLTDEGLCCSFNRLPPEKIFKNPSDINHLNRTYPKHVYDWTPQNGFNIANDGDLNAVPLRPSGAGTHLGLTVIVDAHIDDYYCSSTDSVGFKGLLFNPIETPKISDFGFLVSPGFEFRYNIKPQIQEAKETIRNVKVEKRQCFFQNERPLRYFRSYTKRNCNLECQSNHTLRQCGCIPFYLPKNKKIKVCGKSAEQCVLSAKGEILNC